MYNQSRMESSTTEKIIGWGVVAGFGGAVKYLAAVIRSSESLSQRRFVFLLIANMLISSFCGLIGGLLMTTMTSDQTWTFLGAGIFGYAGTQGLDIAIFAVRKKIEPATKLSEVAPLPPSLNGVS